MKGKKVMDKQKTNIIVLVGQTASGKTSTAIRLAKEIGGEIISADSRQVYKHLNIGTDKVTAKQMQGVPHHLLDIIDLVAGDSLATHRYTVSDFVNDASAAIADITSRGKVPIIAGGTMLYIDALMGNVNVPEVPPNQKLRSKLEQLSPTWLFEKLKDKDPRRAEMLVKEGQGANSRRLIRALEIIHTLGKVPENTQVNKCTRGHFVHFNALWIGLHNDPDIQKEKINKRNAEMLHREHRSKASMLDEVRGLIDIGITQEQFNTFGFEYKYPAMYLSNIPIILNEPPTLEQVLMKMNSSTWRYAKKQRAWWSGREEIRWFRPDNYSELLKTVRKFLN